MYLSLSNPFTGRCSNAPHCSKDHVMRWQTRPRPSSSSKGRQVQIRREGTTGCKCHRGSDVLHQAALVRLKPDDGQVGRDRRSGRRWSVGASRRKELAVGVEEICKVG